LLNQDAEGKPAAGGAFRFVALAVPAKHPNEAGHGRPASGRRFERRQGWHSEIKRPAPSGLSSCG